MTTWQCAQCRAQVAPGAPRCPECPSTQFIKPDAEADMLKIARDGTVSDSAAVAALLSVEVDDSDAQQKLAAVQAKLDELAAVEPLEHPGTGEPMEGVEHPADGTMSPLVGNDAPEGAPEPVQVTQLPPGEFAEPEPVVSPRPPRRTPPPGA